MFEIFEHEEELNNSFENIRKTFKKPKSLDDFDGEEEQNASPVKNSSPNDLKKKTPKG